MLTFVSTDKAIKNWKIKVNDILKMPQEFNSILTEKVETLVKSLLCDLPQHHEYIQSTTSILLFFQQIM